MDRPSTIMLCSVVPGIGFKIIRVFSASATNSGSSSVFRKAASTACTRSRDTPGGMAYGGGSNDEDKIVIRQRQHRFVVTMVYPRS
jgi:hypothetical protein